MAPVAAATFNLSLEGLSASTRSVLQPLLEVAQRRSICNWAPSTMALADALIVDAFTLALGQIQAPCFIMIGEIPLGMKAQKVVGIAADSLTVSNLLDALDRAAVFLLDQRSRRAREQRAEVAAAPQEAGEVGASLYNSYKLLRWMVLPAPFNNGHYARAMVLMTNRWVTPAQLEAHAGISLAEVRLLLNELSRRRILQTDRSAAAADGAAASAGTAASAAGVGANVQIRKVEASFLRRFSTWLGM